jgi:hypothetical protein
VYLTPVKKGESSGTLELCHISTLACSLIGLVVTYDDSDEDSFRGLGQFTRRDSRFRLPVTAV